MDSGAPFLSTDVFVSHSSKDAATADRVRDLLEQRSTRVWIAPRDVPYGSEFEDAIVSGILRCRMLLLLLSVNSANSPHVRREVSVAAQENRVILPVELERIHLPEFKVFYYYLVNIQRFDATSGLDADCSRRLADAVAGCLAGKPAAVIANPVNQPVAESPASKTTVEAVAAYETARSYRLGQGRSRDAAAALNWTRKAAMLGHPEAQCEWGYHLQQSVKNIPDAIQWYEKAAAQGVREALFQLGLLFKSGKGVRADRPKSESLFLEAARLGHRASQFELAKMHHEAGQMHLAREWARLAAAKGHPSATALLQQLGGSGILATPG